jgi:DNA-binding XRE family transcriptional regulator
MSYPKKQKTAPSEFGKTIAAYRKKLGWSRLTTAEYLSVTYATICNLENGTGNANPHRLWCDGAVMALDAAADAVACAMGDIRPPATPKKYAVYPGPVQYADRPWMVRNVGFNELCELYGVDKSEAVNVPYLKRTGKPLDITGLIELRPRWDGKYELPTK